MYALKSQPGAFENTVTSRALDLLDDDAFHTHPSAEDSIALCADRISEALRTRDPRAMASWIQYETHAATDREIYAVLDASCNAVAMETSDLKERNSTLAFIERLRSKVSDDLHSMRSHQRIDEMTSSNTKAVIAGLLSAIDAYDAETAIHLKATAALARSVAEAMALQPKMIADIELAALLHDIGKIKVSVAILNKPGALTDSEWESMRRHPQTGYDMLEKHPELRHISFIVRAHHERIDGRGYPERLVGDDIPLEARVVAVADAFHAMTVKRSYRKPMMPREALDELYACRNTQFDQNVVAAICEHFEYTPREPRVATVTNIQEVRRGA
jgi:putative nucleotidyltransferase with HDIG domain